MEKGSLLRRHGVAWPLGVLTSAVNDSLETVNSFGTAAAEAHWIEVSARALLNPAWKELEALQELSRLTFSAIRSQSLNLAGTDELDFVALKKLRESVRFFQPLYFVEKLGWSKHNNHETFLSLPTIYNEEILEHVISRVFRVQELLGRTILIENSMHYVQARQSVIQEWDFLREISRVTGCDLSLNLSLVWASAQNFKHNAKELREQYLAIKPRLLRLQGLQTQGELFLPSSDQGFQSEFSNYANETLSKFQGDVVLEVVPKISSIQEIKKSLQLQFSARSTQENAQVPQVIAEGEYQRPHFVQVAETEKNLEKLEYENYQSKVLARVTQMNSAEPEFLNYFVGNKPLTADVGLSIYNTSYFVQLRTYFRKQFPLLMTCAGAGFDRLLVQYLANNPPESSSPLMVGQYLEDYLRSQTHIPGLQLPALVLADIAKFEWAQLELSSADPRGSIEPSALSEMNDSLFRKVGLNFNGLSKVIEVDFDVGKLWKNLLKGRPTPLGKQEKKHFLIYRGDDQIQHLLISRAEAKAYRFFEERHSFMKVNELMISQKEGGVTDKGRMLQMLLEFAHRWMSLSIVEGLRFHHPDVVNIDATPWDHSIS